MKKTFALLLTSLLACASFQCRKEKNSANSGSTPEDKLIMQAKQYFERDVLLPAAKTTPEANLRKKARKTVDWSRAVVAKLPDRLAVVAPISFQKNLYFSSNLTPGVPMSIDSLSTLLIFQDKESQFQRERQETIRHHSHTLKCGDHTECFANQQ